MSSYVRIKSVCARTALDGRCGRTVRTDGCGRVRTDGADGCGRCGQTVRTDGAEALGGNLFTADEMIISPYSR